MSWCLSHGAEVRATPTRLPRDTLRIPVLSRLWAAQPVCAYARGSKTEAHEEVKGGAGLAPGDVHAAAAVVQHSLTQVGALLHLLLEEQVSKLEETQGGMRQRRARSQAPWLAVATCKCLFGQAKSPKG